MAKLEFERAREREAKIMEKQLGRDQLTNTYNRVGLRDRLMEMMREPENYLNHNNETLVGQDVLVFMLDLDFFKKFNDKYGHGVGDNVLQEFSQVLMKSIRQEDIALRYGGEEFVLFMFGASQLPDEVYEEIDKRLVDLPITTGRGRKVKINFSAGADVVSWNEMMTIVSTRNTRELNNAVADVCENADQALRQAKDRGRGRLIISLE